MVRVANAAMERAIRRISVERGHDPRRFTLVAFGGGGPLHACELAEQLRIPRVLVPAVPGALSALGMLVASPTRATSRTVLLSLNEREEAVIDDLRDAFAPLAEYLREAMSRDGHDPLALHYDAVLAMRYSGQSHELDVAYHPDLDADGLRSAFGAVHAARYGYRLPDAPVEIVTLRLTASAADSSPAPTHDLTFVSTEADFPAAALLGEVRFWAAGSFHAAPALDRASLRAGHRFTGPALLYQYDTTTLVPPGWMAQVDTDDNLLLEHEIVTPSRPSS
jgi:N-methylhydantoinase A